MIVVWVNYIGYGSVSLRGGNYKYVQFYWGKTILRGKENSLTRWNSLNISVISETNCSGISWSQPNLFFQRICRKIMPLILNGLNQPCGLNKLDIRDKTFRFVNFRWLRSLAYPQVLCVACLHAVPKKLREYFGWSRCLIDIANWKNYCY